MYTLSCYISGTPNARKRVNISYHTIKEEVISNCEYKEELEEREQLSGVVKIETLNKDALIFKKEILNDDASIVKKEYLNDDVSNTKVQNDTNGHIFKTENVDESKSLTIQEEFENDSILSYETHEEDEYKASDVIVDIVQSHDLEVCTPVIALSEERNSVQRTLTKELDAPIKTLHESNGISTDLVLTKEPKDIEKKPANTTTNAVTNIRKSSTIKRKRALKTRNDNSEHLSHFLPDYVNSWLVELPADGKMKGDDLPLICRFCKVEFEGGTEDLNIHIEEKHYKAVRQKRAREGFAY